MKIFLWFLAIIVTIIFISGYLIPYLQHIIKLYYLQYKLRKSAKKNHTGELRDSLLKICDLTKEEIKNTKI